MLKVMKVLYVRVLKLLGMSLFNYQDYVECVVAARTPDIRSYCDLLSIHYSEANNLEVMKKFVVYQVDMVKKKNGHQHKYVVAHVRYTDHIHGTQVTKKFCLLFERGQGNTFRWPLHVSDSNVDISSFKHVGDTPSQTALPISESPSSVPNNTAPTETLSQSLEPANLPFNIALREGASDTSTPHLVSYPPLQHSDTQSSSVSGPSIDTLRGSSKLIRICPAHVTVSFLGKLNKQSKTDVTLCSHTDFQQPGDTASTSANSDMPFTLTLFDFALAARTVSEMSPIYRATSSNCHLFMAGIHDLLQAVYRSRVCNPETRNVVWKRTLMGVFRTPKKGSIGQCYNTVLRQHYLKIEKAHTSRHDMENALEAKTEAARLEVEAARFNVEIARLKVEAARFKVETATLKVETATLKVEAARFKVETARSNARQKILLDKLAAYEQTGGPEPGPNDAEN